MDIGQIFLLSLIQGIAEFLPVSSSAHLMLFPFLFNIKDQGILTDVFAHIGSLLALVYFYRKELFNITKSIFIKKADRSLFWNILVATVPIIIIGLVLFIYKVNFRNPWVIVWSSIIFGILFYLADVFGKKVKNIKDISLKDSMFIGLSQIFAIIPGASRSGSTLTCSRILGIKREDALKFSFLLAVPTIMFAGLGEMLDFILNPVKIDILPMFLVMVFSFIFSLMTIKFMLIWLRHSSFKIFAIYRIFLGIFLYFYLK